MVSFFKSISKAFKKLGKSIGKAFKAIENIGRKAIELHKNIFEEAGRFVKKYGKQILIVAAAAAITYFSVGTLSGFGAAMLSGAYLGAGIGAAITAINGGSIKEIINAGFNGAISGAVAGASAYSIGMSMGTPNFGSANFVGKGLAHGVSGGIQAEVNGGDFKNGFISASISYGLTPLNEQVFGTPQLQPDNAFQRIAFSSAVGATTSYVSGGNVLEGALTAGFVRAYNCETTSWSSGNYLSVDNSSGDLSLTLSGVTPGVSPEFGFSANSISMGVAGNAFYAASGGTGFGYSSNVGVYSYARGCLFAQCYTVCAPIPTPKIEVINYYNSPQGGYDLMNIFKF